jgi:hypothetical protein
MIRLVPGSRPRFAGIGNRAPIRAPTCREPGTRTGPRPDSHWGVCRVRPSVGVSGSPQGCQARPGDPESRAYKLQRKQGHRAPADGADANGPGMSPLLPGKLHKDAQQTGFKRVECAARRSPILTVTRAQGRRQLIVGLGHWACITTMSSTRGTRASAVHDTLPSPAMSTRRLEQPLLYDTLELLGKTRGRTEAQIIPCLSRNAWRCSTHDSRENADPV